MSGEEVQRLLNQLQDLSLERERIENQERRVLREIGTALNNNQVPIGGGEPPAVVLDPVAEAEPVAAIEPPQPGVFETGQHIYIVNRISHVFGRRSTFADRAAVVTRVSGQRIYFETYNGYQGWRARGNIRHQTLAEIQAHPADHFTRQFRR